MVVGELYIELVIFDNERLMKVGLVAILGLC